MLNAMLTRVLFETMSLTMASLGRALLYDAHDETLNGRSMNGMYRICNEFMLSRKLMKYNRKLGMM